MCYEQIPGNTHYCEQYKLYTEIRWWLFYRTVLVSKAINVFKLFYTHI